MVLKRRPPILISSVGDPSAIVPRVHDWGGLSFHDVTTVRHAEKAAEAITAVAAASWVFEGGSLEAAERQKVRGDISAMVSEKPDEVAAMLRGWLSESKA